MLEKEFKFHKIYLFVKVWTVPFALENYRTLKLCLAAPKLSAQTASTTGSTFETVAHSASLLWVPPKEMSYLNQQANSSIMAL